MFKYNPLLCSFCLQLIFFSEKPFYGNYSTLDSHTNTVISHTFAYSSRWRRKVYYPDDCNFIEQDYMKSGHDTYMGYPYRYSSCIPNQWKICCKNSGDPRRTIAVEKNGTKTFFPSPRDLFFPYKNGGRRRWQKRKKEAKTVMQTLRSHTLSMFIFSKMPCKYPQYNVSSVEFSQGGFKTIIQASSAILKT